MRNKERLEGIETCLKRLTPIFPTQVCLAQDWLINRVRVLGAALEQRPNMDSETFQSISTSFQHEYDSWEVIARAALTDGESEA